VSIRNLDRDFGSGLAFCAIMHGVFPDKVSSTSILAYLFLLGFLEIVLFSGRCGALFSVWFG
jgi:hypothetical protein